jgi:hypothetical protein
MAYFDLYVRTGGSNLNAGTTDSDSPTLSVTGASINETSTGVLTITAASGTPFSAVSVGQWVAVSFSSDTATSFISQITAINGGGSSVTCSNENSAAITFFGQYSTSNNGNFGLGANTVNIRVGGAWASIVPMTTLSALYQPLAKMGSATGYSIRINIKTGTYSSSSSITLVTPTTIGKPLFLRGYNSTAGDLDNVANPGTHPLLSFSSTANLTIPNYCRLENIDVSTSGTANPLISASGLNVQLTRCRFTGTSGVLNISGAGFDSWACYFATTSTTVANIVSSSNGGMANLTECVVDGGLYCVTASYQINAKECVFKNSTSHVVLASTVNQGTSFHRCVFYNSGTSSDAILIASNTNFHSISFCIFHQIKRYAINVTNSSYSGIRLAGNDYSSITSGQLNGVYESYQHAALTESSSPFTAAGSNDFTVISTATVFSQTFVYEMP